MGKVEVTSVSMIIPWCDRPELLTSLSANAKALMSADVEVIVANCGGRQKIESNVQSLVKGLLVRWIDIPVANFNKALALNLGASFSTREALLFLDADVILRSQLEEFIGALTPASFVTIGSVFESGASVRVNTSAQFVDAVTHAVEFRLSSGETHSVLTNRLDLSKGARSGPGLILLWRADFLEVGGMNRELTGWGWDDLDLVARLQMALGRVRREVGSVLHLSHGDDVRYLPQGSRGENEARNFMNCLAGYTVGDFRGTYETDLAEYASIVVGPYPNGT